MKMFLRITALLLFVAMIVPMAAACAEKEDSGTTTEASGTTTAAAEDKTDPVTDPVTDPPPTDPPLDPIDPSLPYYEYLNEEFRRFGFVDGDLIVADSEEATLSKFIPKGCTAIALDLSGEDVPFGFANRYEIASLPNPENEFWQIAIEAKFDESKTITTGDILAGCVYVRDAGGENPAHFYTAIKTPTDNWGSEGSMGVHDYVLEPGEGWQKIYFYGEFVNDENPASTAMFNFFLGYDPHNIEIGGLYVMRYPGTDENFKATMKMPY